MKRLNEKLFFEGKEKLTDYELLTLTLSDAKVSEQLLTTYGSLAAIHQALASDLKKVAGMGKGKIARLQAGFELFRRIQTEKIDRGKRLLNSKDVFETVSPLFMGAIQEIFIVLPLDSKNRLLTAPIIISKGSIMMTVVHPRDVIRKLIDLNAISAILCHNHPSSHDPVPSEDDIQLSKRLKEAGEIIGVEILDHLVVGGTEYFSFRDEGMW